MRLLLALQLAMLAAIALPWPARTQNFGNIQPHTVLGNPTGTPGPAMPMSMVTLASVEQWGSGIAGNGTTDDTGALNNALTAFAAAGGGEIAASRKYLINSGHLTVPSSVTLRGSWAHPGIVANGDYTVAAGSLIMGAASTVHVMASAGLQGMIVRAANLIAPGTGTTTQQLVNLYAIRANMTGTGVCIGDCSTTTDTGSAAVVRDNLIIGFAQCLSTGTNNMFTVENNFGDCTNGFKIGDTGENGVVSHNRMWVFTTYGGPGGTLFGVYSYGPAIQSITNAGGLIKINIPAHIFSTGQTVSVMGAAANTNANGRWTITKVDANNVTLDGSTFANAGGVAGNIYTDILARDGAAFETVKVVGAGCDHCRISEAISFGWKYGIRLNSSNLPHIISPRLDYPTGTVLATTATRGILIDGNTAQATISDPKITGFGIGVHVATMASPRPQHTLVAPAMFGIQQQMIQVDADTLTVVGGSFSNQFGVCSVIAYGGVLNLGGGLTTTTGCQFTPSGGAISLGDVYRGAAFAPRSPFTTPVIANDPAMSCIGGLTRWASEGTGQWDFQVNTAAACDFSTAVTPFAYSAQALTFAGKLFLPGVPLVANCTGQPAKSVIATTGTGALVQCP